MLYLVNPKAECIKLLSHQTYYQYINNQDLFY